MNNSWKDKDLTWQLINCITEDPSFDRAFFLVLVPMCRLPKEVAYPKHTIIRSWRRGSLETILYMVLHLRKP